MKKIKVKGRVSVVVIKTLLETKFVLHEDSGHGWLEVPYKALVTLGIESKISEWSYQDGEKVYLEEGRDAMLFIKKLYHYMDKHPGMPDLVIEEVYEGLESFILQFERYRVR